MGAFEDYLAEPTDEGAAERGRLATFIIPPNLGEPPPPAEILTGHKTAFLVAYRRERMSQAAGLARAADRRGARLTGGDRLGNPEHDDAHDHDHKAGWPGTRALSGSPATGARISIRISSRPPLVGAVLTI